MWGNDVGVLPLTALGETKLCLALSSSQVSGAMGVFDLGSYSPVGSGPGLAPNLWTVLCCPDHAPAWKEYGKCGGCGSDRDQHPSPQPPDAGLRQQVNSRSPTQPGLGLTGMGTQEGWETDSPEIPSPEAADAQMVPTQHPVLVPALFLDNVFHFQVPCCRGLLMLTVHLPNPLLECLPHRLPARIHSVAHLW